MASGGASVAVLILTACANGLRRRMCAAGGRGNDHFRGLRCMLRPAAYARKSNRALHLLTPLSAQVVGQGFMTFSRPARTTRRGNVEQVWPPCRPLHFANPSPIMPKHPPHTAHVRMAPPVIQQMSKMTFPSSRNNAFLYVHTPTHPHNHRILFQSPRPELAAGD